MKKTLAFVLLLTVGLAGCTSAPVANDTSDPTAQPTKTAEPAGPVELTEDEAAKRYLNIVCDNNAAITALTAAFAAAEPEFLAGGSPDMAAVKDAASTRLTLSRSAIELLEDEHFIWPKSVAEQVPHIRSTYMAELSTLDGMINAAKFEDAYYATWPAATPEQQAAGQEIRYALGLDADTTASCADNLGGIQTLMEEKSEREAQ